MTNFDKMRERLEAQAGLFCQPSAVLHTLSALMKSEWSPEFEQLIRNRLIMGALRYGTMKSNKKADYRRIASVIRRLRKYESDGNLEHLVDAANLCLLEFENGAHPKKHFSAQDDTNERVTKG